MEGSREASLNPERTRNRKPPVGESSRFNPGDAKVGFDPSVFLGPREVNGADGTAADMYGDHQVDSRVSGGDLDDESLDRIRGWVMRSPVYNLMTLGHEASPQLSLTSEQSI